MTVQRILQRAAPFLGLLLVSCGRVEEGREASGVRPSSRGVGSDTSLYRRWRAARYAPGPPLVPIAPPASEPAAGVVTPALPTAPDSWPPPQGPPPAGFRPPTLKSRPALRSAAVRGEVELDLFVDATGRVTRADWAGGSRDTAQVRAARECALGMVFYPALREGRPVPAASRQRFRFDARGP